LDPKHDGMEMEPRTKELENLKNNKGALLGIAPGTCLGAFAPIRRHAEVKPHDR